GRHWFRRSSRTCRDHGRRPRGTASLAEPRGVSRGSRHLPNASGPLAIQVGIYVGYVRRGVVGAWMAGAAFILPPFLIVLACAYLYERFSALTQVQALFYGISPVVIALIMRSCYTLGKIALKDAWLW